MLHIKNQHKNESDGNNSQREPQRKYCLEMTSYKLLTPCFSGAWLSVGPESAGRASEESSTYAGAGAETTVRRDGEGERKSSKVCVLNLPFFLCHTLLPFIIPTLTLISLFEMFLRLVHVRDLS